MTIVEVVELEGGAPAAQDRWMRRAVLVAIVALFAASVAGLVTLAPKGKRTPAQQLAKLQAFVAGAKTVHYASESTTESKQTDTGLGTSFNNKSRSDGDVILPDQVHSVEQDGNNFNELIKLHDGTYSRAGDNRAKMLAAQWVYAGAHVAPELDGGSVGSAPNTGMAFPGVAIGSGVAPSLFGHTEASLADGGDIAAFIKAAGAPKQVAPNVIEVTIDPKKIGWPEPPEGISATFPKPTITARLTSAPDGTLERVVTTIVMKMGGEGGGNSADSLGIGTFTSTYDVQLSGWNKPVTIAKPGAETIDPTPGIDEQDLAAFNAMPLLAPGKVPAGYELTGAHVSTSVADASPADGNCPEVDLDYANPAATQAFYDKITASHGANHGIVDGGNGPPDITVTLTPTSCDYTDAGDNAKPIRAGRYAGTITRGNVNDGDYAETIEVIVGATRVGIATDLPEPQAVAMAANLVPFNLATQPVHHVAPPQ